MHHPLLGKFEWRHGFIGTEQEFELKINDKPIVTSRKRQGRSRWDVCWPAGGDHPQRRDVEDALGCPNGQPLVLLLPYAPRVPNTVNNQSALVGLLLALKQGNADAILDGDVRLQNPYLLPPPEWESLRSEKLGLDGLWSGLSYLKYAAFARLEDPSTDRYGIVHPVLGNMTFQLRYVAANSTIQREFDLMIDGETIIQAQTMEGEPVWDVKWLAAEDSPQRAEVERVIGGRQGFYWSKLALQQL